MQDFHFLRPYWFLLLLPIGLLIAWLWRGHHASVFWKKICDEALLSYMLVHAETRRSFWPLALIGMAGLLCTLALAGPTFEQQPTPVFKQQKALVIILDLSSSMLAQDAKPNRLTQAKRKVLDILQRRKEGQTALVVFAGNAHAVSPLTEDTQTIIALVDSLTPDLMPLQGSRPDRGLSLARSLLKQAGIGQAHILFVMDGLSGAAKTAWQKQLPLPYSISIIGVGHAEGVPIPKPGGGIMQDHAGNIVLAKLKAAELTELVGLHRGRYHMLTTTNADLDKTVTPYLQSLPGDTYAATQLKADRWKEIGPWLLLPVLLIAAVGFRRGVLMILFSVFIPYPSDVHAATWDDFWQRPDQRGQNQFEQGNYKASAGLFQNQRWQSASHYRAGDYEKSIEALAEDESAEADYQRGNALAKLGRYPEALERFKSALAKDNNHVDAEHNRQSIQTWLQEQSKADNSDQSDDSKSSDSKSDNPKSDDPKSADSKAGDEKSSNAKSEDSQANDSEADQAESNNAKSDDSNSNASQTDGSQPEKKSPAENTPSNSAKSASPKPDEPELTASDDAESQPDQPTSKPVKPNQSTQTAQDALSKEQQQALEQWLRRIPDDPGGLLRRKFEAQYKREKQPYPEEEQAW